MAREELLDGSLTRAVDGVVDRARDGDLRDAARGTRGLDGRQVGSRVGEAAIRGQRRETVSHEPRYRRVKRLGHLALALSETGGADLAPDGPPTALRTREGVPHARALGRGELLRRVGRQRSGEESEVALAVAVAAVGYPTSTQGRVVVEPSAAALAPGG